MDEIRIGIILGRTVKVFVDGDGELQLAALEDGEIAQRTRFDWVAGVGGVDLPGFDFGDGGAGEDFDFEGFGFAVVQLDVIFEGFLDVFNRGGEERRGDASC